MKIKKILTLCILTTLLLVGYSASANILIGQDKDCQFIENSQYKPFSDINGQFPVFGRLIVNGTKGCVGVGRTVDSMINIAFQVFLSVITLMSVVQVSVAGIQWMMKDTSESKSNAKQKLINAIIGLILAMSSWLILRTVNKNLVSGSIDFNSNPLTGVIQSGVNQANIETVNSSTPGGTPPANGTVPGSTLTPATSDVQGVLGLGQDGARSQNGGLNLSLYASAGDSTTDSNTASQRGNNDNLLVDGSVALSPDLVAKYKPKPGQEIRVNGATVGYFDDTTGDNTDPINKTGTPIVNTVDIYNPNGTYGNTNKTLKVIPAGGYEITLGPTVRPQTPNPSPSN